MSCWGRSPGVKCAAGGGAQSLREVPQRLRCDENIFSSPPNGQGHEAVRKMDELLSIDCWHKPPRALAGPKSTSAIRSSHHLEEKGNKKRRHDSPINLRRGVAFMFINIMSTRLHCARAASISAYSFMYSYCVQSTYSYCEHGVKQTQQPILQTAPEWHTLNQY